MPQTAIDITGAADRSRVSGTIPLEGGTIKAVTAFALVAGTDPATTWCEIGLMSDETDLQNRVAILDAGYVGTAAPAGWTGTIKGEPAMYVYCDVYSSDSAVIRLSVLVEND